MMHTPTKVHTGRMLNRSPYPYPHMRVQIDSGRIVDVRIPPALFAQASRVYGDEYVRYIYRGGRAYYHPYDYDEEETP